MSNNHHGKLCHKETLMDGNIESWFTIKQEKYVIK